MRVNRTLLYAGIFLVAIGSVVVAVDLGAVDDRRLADALGLWPVALIAIGLGLVLRHTRASLSGGMLAAAVPGLLLGSAFAVAPRFAEICGGDGSPARAVAQHGTFDGPASVSVAVDCGSLRVTTTAGSEWQLDVPADAARRPVVAASARALSISSLDHSWWPGAERDSWELALPTSSIGGLSLRVDAGRADIDLSGARVDRLEMTANASEVYVDATAAELARVSGKLNLGLLSLQLRDNDVTGSFRVNAGVVKICTPPELGLVVISSGDLQEIRVGGVRQAGSAWQSDGYLSATNHAELDVRVDLGAIEINPIGGCK